MIQAAFLEIPLVLLVVYSVAVLQSVLKRVENLEKLHGINVENTRVLIDFITDALKENPIVLRAKSNIQNEGSPIK